MTIDHLRNLVLSGAVLDVVVKPTEGGYHLWADTLQGLHAIETVRGCRRTWRQLDTVGKNLADCGIAQWRYETPESQAGA